MSSSVAAQIEVADSGHEILVEHYQNLANKAETKLDRDFAAAQSEYYSDNKEFWESTGNHRSQSVVISFRNRSH